MQANDKLRKPYRTQKNYAYAVEEAPPEAGPREEDPPPPAPPKKRGFGFFRRQRPEDEPVDEGPQEYTDENLPKANVVLDEVIKVKKETLDAIHRTERMVNETEAIGHESLQAVSKNREQIHAIDSEMDRLEPMTNRAKRDAAIFARQIFRDKCFMCLGTLVVLAIIAVILAVTVFKKDDDTFEPVFDPNATDISNVTTTAVEETTTDESTTAP